MPVAFDLYLGDCMEYMASLPDSSVDSVVTDPPYEIDIVNTKWDSTGIAHSKALWAECMRVLKPGAHLVAFSAARTYHRLACAVEDAGLEIRDQVLWLYGNGFPKGADVSKAVDAWHGAERRVVAYRYLTPVGVVGGQKAARSAGDRGLVPITEPATEDAVRWDGWRTALKPAHEPAVLARKPFSGGLAQNVLAYGTGGLNVGACRVDGGVPAGGLPPLGYAPSPDGSGDIPIAPYGEDRYPTNVLYDGSEDAASVLGGFQKAFYCAKVVPSDRWFGVAGKRRAGMGFPIHPTTKPIALMRYICRLVTPPGGTVLDPFAGSGTTGVAAMLEGFTFKGAELDPDFHGLAVARVEAARGVGHQPSMF